MAACALSSAAADYTTYIGDQYQYTVSAIAVDGTGNTYATGSRAVMLPGSSATSLNDIFVTKVDSAGTPTLLATLSGKGSDQANGIALDLSGNIYIVGSTSSPDFPLYHPLQTVPSFGGGTGFLVKLSPDGGILYSTYLGGTKGSSSMKAVAADAQGNAYVAGETFASDYPHTAGLPAGSASGGVGAVSAAFFAKISPAGDKLVYSGGIAATARTCGCCSSCFLSTLSTAGVSIGLDAAGNAYIGGNTNGTGLPVTPGAFLTNGSGAFIAKVNAAGNELMYLTYMGSLPTLPPGPAPTQAYSIAVDAVGNAYVSGGTTDTSFPATAEAFQTKLPVPAGQTSIFPPADAFVAKLNPTGNNLIWATFLGGTGSDQAQTLAIDPAGNVWMSGITQSTDFPAASGFPGGGEFLAEFNPTGSSLLYASRFPSSSVGTALALDPGGVVHAAGSTGLLSTLTPSQSAETRLFGVANAAAGQLAGRVAPGELISLYGLHFGAPAPVSATFNSAGFLPITLGGLQVTLNGTPAPLLYVSDTQINAVAPLELVNVASASLQITRNNMPLPALGLRVDAAIPAAFVRPDGTAAAVNQDGTINSQTNPAKAGSIVSIWATGVGFTQGVDGQMATAAQPLCFCGVYTVPNNQLITPAYAGAAPGLVTGIVQINFPVATLGPLQTPAAYYSLGPNGSQTFSIFVAP